ncbi:MAG: class I SAM-dependent methyltransferase [Candidatus Hydrogenedentes bacterium]|nr:class I SAM-dependent methyltransferase [Candidatus Hydrogenedentota bacterium]
MNLSAEAEAYAAADFAEVNEAFVARLLELAGDRADAVALDLGTGPGDMPIRIVRQRPGWRIVAVDASFAMLRLARRAIAEAGASHVVVPVQTDAKGCPFLSGAFDIIFSNSIVHHITDVAAFWNEVKRLAKPGGHILLRDLSRPPSPEAARRIVETYAAHESPLLQEEFYRSLLSAYTPDEVRTQLDAAGLEGLSVVMSSDRHWDVFSVA